MYTYDYMSMHDTMLGTHQAALFSVRLPSVWQIQASTCVSSVHSTHIREALLTPTHLALVLDYEAGGSVAEFVAKQVLRAGR